MKILVIGSGGREGSITLKLAQHLHETYCAPGTPGTATYAWNVPIRVTEIEKLVKFAKDVRIDLTVVGPEAPLYLDITGAFKRAGLRIYAPSKAAAQLEGSKAFMHGIADAAGIETARHGVFSSRKKALAFAQELGACFVKPDGPAGGHGAIPCSSVAKAEAALYRIMELREFGKSGERVVIEEWLPGEELSPHFVCDGRWFVPFPFARDYKRENRSPGSRNTGGLGSYAPVETDYQLYWQSQQIAACFLHELNKRRIEYRGTLYPGLIVHDSKLKVLEANARFGDPETQVLLPLLKSDLAELLFCATEGDVNQAKVAWKEGYAVCVVCASKGYPGELARNHVPIEGIEEAERIPDVTVFHSGTTIKDGTLVTNGGRVLSVTAFDTTLQNAVARAYEAVNCIHFDGMWFRPDIGEGSLAAA